MMFPELDLVFVFVFALQWPLGEGFYGFFSQAVFYLDAIFGLFLKLVLCRGSLRSHSSQ